MDDSAKTGLALHNSVGDTHLLAERRKEDDELNRLDIVGDEDERSLLVLDKTNNVVETVLDSVRLLADILLLLALLDGGSLLEETLLLLRLGLRSVLVEELKSLGSGVAVEDVLELSKRRRDLQAELEDLLLSLKADVLGPLNHAGDISLGLEVLADTEVSGSLLEERVLKNCQLRPEVSRRILISVPWEPSYQPFPEGRGRRRPSCQIWGAVIEKRRYQRVVLANRSSLNSSESRRDISVHAASPAKSSPGSQGTPGGNVN